MCDAFAKEHKVLLTEGTAQGLVANEGHIRTAIADSSKKTNVTSKLRDAKFLRLEVTGRHNSDPASDSKAHTTKRVISCKRQHIQRYSGHVHAVFHVEKLVAKDQPASSERNIFPRIPRVLQKRYRLFQVSFIFLEYWEF